VVALISSAVAWACWAQVDQVVIAPGKLITTESPVIIQTASTAPIREMLVNFGDRVKAGDVLATLDPTFSEADVKQLEAKNTSLSARVARLKAERASGEFDIADHRDDPDWLLQKQVFLERKNEYLAKQQEFDAERNKLIVQQENNEREIEQSIKNYSDYRAYEAKIKALAARGSKSDSDVLSRRLQTGDAKMKVVSNKSRKLELVRELESLSTRREAYNASWRAKTASELVAATDELTTTEQELNKANRARELVQLTVPENLEYKDFVVFEVADRSVGSVLRPGEPLFKLVPIDVPMELEVEVAGKDIAKVQSVASIPAADQKLPSGSEVRIKLASFPYQKHGTLDGVVRTISEGSFEKQAAGPGGNAISTGETTYKARVRLLEPIQLDQTPDNFRLMPGMAATAEIKVGRRRVIQYFVYPLIRYLDSSIREP
jgi:HlyD family secretion protein